MVKQFVQEVRKHYRRPAGPIYLIETAMFGNELQFIKNCLDSGKVSTIGDDVPRFEKAVAKRLGAKYALATTSGTSALHLGLLTLGVNPSDLVITTPFTFIATANAILQAGGQPLFIDIDRNNLGLSPEALKEFLESEAEVNQLGHCYHRSSGRRIAACLPVHVFGHPASIADITRICRQHHIPVLEDAAEAVGSTYSGQAVGTFGDIGVLSFNGNKIVTSGGGGMLLTNDKALYHRAYHYANQSKSTQSDSIERVGYNYRMPAVNAALGRAQWENLDNCLQKKRALTEWYHQLFSAEEVVVHNEPTDAFSNYWLQALNFPDQQRRDAFVEETNAAGIETRTAWKCLHHHALFQSPHHPHLPNSEWAESHIANIPSTITANG